FREGFRIAGEDILQEVIQQNLLPAIGAHLQTCGLQNARELLVDRFGADRADMTQQDKHLRRQFVLRVLKPAGLALLAAYENSMSAQPAPPVSRKLFDLVAEGGHQHTPPGARILDHVDKAAAAWGATDFRLADVDVPIDFERIRSAVETTLGDVFDNVAEAVYHFDCDVVLLSGQPS